ncbi:lantibiotic dehydratase [Kitasatospora sp. NPDC086791]|uniref:lantibiotic dehydratase n=1 Tax=Kitasatospora sp. NPDC086791 TaxID=3155178 RepID=UPI003439174B
MSRQWRIGREFILRHAGMPFDWLEELGAPYSLLELADELLDRERAVLELVETRFSGSRAESLRSDVLRGRVRQVPTKSGGAQWSAAVRAWADTWERYALACRQADEEAGERLRDLLADPRVAEAVFLSNPDAYRNMLLPLLAYEGPLTSRWRRVRRQMFTYVQRFCAKNETVSFFGPMAYGTVGEGADAVLRDDVPRVRRVFFSHWAARALATAIARDPGILPRLAFHSTGRGDAAREPLLSLVAPEGTVFREVARAAGQPAREVARTLMRLVAEEAVTVGLGGGDYDLEPLATLRDQLSALPASPARELWLGRIAELSSLIDDLAELPLERKEAAVTALENRFTEFTGKPARRGAGAAYADRAVFFEECASPFALTLGAGLIDDWERQLAPVLEVCAAHGQAAQRAAAAAVRDAFTDGAAGGEGADGTELDLLTYATRAAASRADSTSTFQAAHAPSYPGTDWRAEVERLTDEAAALDGDRYAVIDLCPAAPHAAGLGLAAPLVLSRAHHHLLVHSWLGTMHPDPDRLGADAAAWTAEQDGAVVGLDFGRRNKGYYRFPGREVAMRPLTWTDHDRPELLKPEDLTVRIGPDEVTLHDPDGRTVSAYVPLSDFVKYAPVAALSHPQVLHPTFTTEDAQPEVALGSVVLQRSRWQVPTAALAAPEPEARFLALRRLARDTGSRFVFCRSARERKPYLIDLASPLAADLISHVAGESEQLGVERMSPGPEELWLRDSEGRRYTSELRMQVIGRSSDRNGGAHDDGTDGGTDGEHEGGSSTR